MRLFDIDGHVCWNSNCRLPFIFCQPRKTNFRSPFPFEANKWKFAVSICRLQQPKRKLSFSLSFVFLCLCGGGCVCVCIYLYLYLYESWKPRRFSLIHLPFAHQRKLSVCKQTKQTYPSLLIGICVFSPPPRPTPTTHALLTTTQWQHHDIQRIVSESMLQLIKLATNF